jgi:hypothetical protein
MTLVQQPETAQFEAMLRSAIGTGMVDRVLQQPPRDYHRLCRGPSQRERSHQPPV